MLICLIVFNVSLWVLLRWSWFLVIFHGNNVFFKSRSKHSLSDVYFNSCISLLFNVSIWRSSSLLHFLQLFSASCAYEGLILCVIERSILHLPFPLLFVLFWWLDQKLHLYLPCSCFWVIFQCYFRVSLDFSTSCSRCVCFSASLMFFPWCVWYAHVRRCDLLRVCALLTWRWCFRTYRSLSAPQTLPCSATLCAIMFSDLSNNVPQFRLVCHLPFPVFLAHCCYTVWMTSLLIGCFLINWD